MSDRSALPAGAVNWGAPPNWVGHRFLRLPEAARFGDLKGERHGNAAGGSGCGAGSLAFDHRLHGVLRRVDDLRHHRRAYPTGSWAERDPVRSSHRHPHSHRITQSGFPRHLGRPVWRTHRLCADHAVGGRRHLPALLRHFVSVDARRRPWCRARWRLLRRRHHLCIQVVPTAETRDGARNLRRRQYRRRRHKIRCTVRPRRLRLADGRGGLGIGAGSHGHYLLAHNRRRPRDQGPPGARREAALGDDAIGAAPPPAGLAVLTVLLLRVWWLRRACSVAAALHDRRLRTRY